MIHRRNHLPSSCRRGAVLACFALLSLCVAAAAQQKGGSPEGGKPSGKPDAAAKTRTAQRQSQVALVSKQEPMVRDFVAANHSELAPLLAALKEHNTAEYERAVRELYRVQSRLDSLKQRDPGRYDLELKIWQTKSRAQLVAAKIVVLEDMSEGDAGSSEALHQQLERLIAQNIKMRNQLLRKEKRRQQERIKKLSEQLERNSQPETIGREAELMLKAVRRQNGQSANKSRTGSPKNNRPKDSSDAAKKP